MKDSIAFTSNESCPFQFMYFLFLFRFTNVSELSLDSCNQRKTFDSGNVSGKQTKIHLKSFGLSLTNYRDFGRPPIFPQRFQHFKSMVHTAYLNIIYPSLLSSRINYTFKNLVQNTSSSFEQTPTENPRVSGWNFKSQGTPTAVTPPEIWRIDTQNDRPLKLEIHFPRPIIVGVYVEFPRCV